MKGQHILGERRKGEFIGFYSEVGWLVVLRIHVALAMQNKHKWEMKISAYKPFKYRGSMFSSVLVPREDAGGLSREYVLRISSVS